MNRKCAELRKMTAIRFLNLSGFCVSSHFQFNKQTTFITIMNKLENALAYNNFFFVAIFCADVEIKSANFCGTNLNMVNGAETRVC